MSEEKALDLKGVMRKFNIGLSSIVEFLASKGQKVESKPTSKLSAEQYSLVEKEFSSSAALKTQQQRCAAAGCDQWW
jgi:translation initiation factor IF-2